MFTDLIESLMRTGVGALPSAGRGIKCALATSAASFAFATPAAAAPFKPSTTCAAASAKPSPYEVDRRWRVGTGHGLNTARMQHKRSRFPCCAGGCCTAVAGGLLIELLDSRGSSAAANGAALPAYRVPCWRCGLAGTRCSTFRRCVRLRRYLQGLLGRARGPAGGSVGRGLRGISRF